MEIPLFLSPLQNPQTIPSQNQIEIKIEIWPDFISPSTISYSSSLDVISVDHLQRELLALDPDGRTGGDETVN